LPVSYRDMPDIVARVLAKKLIVCMRDSLLGRGLLSATGQEHNAD